MNRMKRGRESIRYCHQSVFCSENGRKLSRYSVSGAEFIHSPAPAEGWFSHHSLPRKLIREVEPGSVDKYFTRSVGDAWMADANADAAVITLLARPGFEIGERAG